MDSRGSSRPSSRQSCQSTASRHPQSAAELLAYVNKANQTIKLLQEELHTTSQFAIKLTQKYEAKRAERDQVLQQLQLQQRQSHKQLRQLQLLCNYLAQDRQPREMPAAVAAVVVEHAALSSGDSQPAGQLSASLAAKTAEQQHDTPRKVHAAAATSIKQAQQPAQQQTCKLPSSSQAAGAAAVLAVASPGAQTTASSSAAAAATNCPDNAAHTLSSSLGWHGPVQIQQAGASSSRTRDGGGTSGASQSSSTPSRAPSTCLPGAAVEEAAAAVASSSQGPGCMAALQINSSHKNGKQQQQPQQHDQQQRSREQEQAQQRKHIVFASASIRMAAAADESDDINSVAAAPQQRTRPLVTSRPDAVTGQHSSPPASSRSHSKPSEDGTAAGNTSQPSPVVPAAIAKAGRSLASDGKSSDFSSSCSDNSATHSNGAGISGDLGRSEGNASKTCKSAPVKHPAGSVSSTAQTGTGTSSIDSSRSASCPSKQGSCGAGRSRPKSRPHSSRVHERLQHSSRPDTSVQKSARTRPPKCKAKAALVSESDSTASATQLDASSPAPQEVSKQQDSSSTSPPQQSQHSPAPAAAETTCAASPQLASQTEAFQLAAASQQRTSSISPRQQSRWFPESALVVQATEPSSPNSPCLASPCSSGFQSVASMSQDRNSSCRSSFSSMVSACSRSTRASHGSLSAAVSSPWIAPDETPYSLVAAARLCPKASADAGSGCRCASRPSSRSERHATSPVTSPDTGCSDREHSAGDAAASTAARERQSPVKWPYAERNQHSTKCTAPDSSAELRSNSSSPKPGRQRRKGKITAASSCSPCRAAAAAATVVDEPESPCDSKAARGSVQQQQQHPQQQQQHPGADVSGSGANTYSSSQQVLAHSSSEAARLLGLMGSTFSNVRAAAAAVVGAFPSAGLIHTTDDGSAAACGASSSNSWPLIRTLSKQDATETAAAQRSIMELEGPQLDTSLARACKEAVGPVDTSGDNEGQGSNSSSSCEDDSVSSSSSSSSSDNDSRNGSPTEVCRHATAIVESSRAAAASCSFSTWNTAKSASQAGAQLQQQQQQQQQCGLPQLHGSMLGGFHAANVQPGQGGAVRGRRRAAAAVRRGQVHRQQEICTMQPQRSHFVFGQGDGKIDGVEMPVGQVSVAVGAPVEQSSSGCAVGSSSGKGDANQHASAVVHSGTAGAAVSAPPARMPRRVPELRRCFEPPAPQGSSTHEHRRRSHSRCSSSGSSSSSSSEEESGSNDDESFADAEEGSSTHGSSSAAGGSSRNSSRNSSSGGVTPGEPPLVSATAGGAATPGTVSRSNSFGLSLGGLLTSLAAVGGAAAAAMSDRLSPGRSKSRPGRPPWASSGGAGERTAATRSNYCRQASTSTPGAAAAALDSQGPITGRSPLGSPACHSTPVAAAAAVDTAANLPNDLDDDSSSSSSSSGGRAGGTPPGSNCKSDIDSSDSDTGSSEGGSGHAGSNAVAVSPAVADGKGGSSESDDGSEDESRSYEASAGSSSSSEVNDDYGATGRNRFDLLQCSKGSEPQEDSPSEDTSETE